MCVGLYFSVLLLETMPIIADMDWFQKLFPKLSKPMRHIHHYSPILAIFGLGFSMLHQSSLGATYGVMIARPIWFRPNLSVLFIYSAVLGGIALTLFVSMLAARMTPRANVDDRLIDKLAKALGWGLVGYLYFRFWDTFAMNYTYQPGRTEGLQILTQGSLAFNFWIIEVALGMVFPMIVFLNGRLRQNHVIRMIALICVSAGVAAYRWDINLVGQLIVLTYLPHEIIARYTSYFPSLIEFMVGGAVIAYGLLGITIGVRYLNIVDHKAAPHAHEVKQPVTAVPASTD
jgi:molybdopterin-containing oxidoreductase family membrane subunit